MIDPRGTRFAAAITTVVLAVALVTLSPWLLAVQAVVFAVGVIAGPAASPYGVVFARVVRPRLGPPEHLEHSRPPRFAQTVGLVFALAGLLGLAVGSSVVFTIAVAAALAAAFLNAAFGFCLGCELYLALVRISQRSTQRGGSPAVTTTEVNP